VSDPIADALDAFVPAFDSPQGDWQAILEAAAQPAAVAAVHRGLPAARRRARTRALLGRRSVRVALALAVLAIGTTGVAWAAGAFDQTPLTLFETHSPADTGSGPIWAGPVIADSVEQVASVEIPKVGPVALWHADTKQGGWCLGLRLSNGDWLGRPPAAGGSPLDGGGSVPGCFPTGVIDGGTDHLEWLENDIDAHSVGGTFWRIRSGVITVPGAVKVTDLTTGTSTDVVDGNVFLLAVEAPNPAVPGNDSPRLHLVAYDKDGNVVASDCRHCSGG
jgi:hypothetical protein